MDGESQNTTSRILCSRLVIPRIKEEDALHLQWLIGSPFFPSRTIVSTLRCIHTLSSDSLSPDFSKETDDIRILLPKGFEVIGALIADGDSDVKKSATKAIDAAIGLRKLLHGNAGRSYFRDQELVGAVLDLNNGDIQFFISRNGSQQSIEAVSSVTYEDQPEKYVWQKGCLLHCEVPIKLPVYYPVKNLKDAKNTYMLAIKDVERKLVDPGVTYIFEAQSEPSAREQPIIIHSAELDLRGKISSESAPESSAKSLACSFLCSKAEEISSFTSMEQNADKIQVSILSNQSRSSLSPAAPIAEYYPAVEDAKILVVDHKLDVLCYAAKDLLLASAVSKLIIPALVDQLQAMRNTILPNLLTENPQLHPYHFVPPGFLHPITAIYELSFGETEMKQVQVRRSLHLRLGLPLDRPLLRVANAINLNREDNARANSVERGTSLLRDVHLGISGSGVSGGSVSRIQGSYEYYHYLVEGLDDSGWGCAYRSLQTIVSWFKLQHYTGIDVPSHREIQRSLVEIGDKDPSFVGSREWIGAIELSFVLDKLLGVSCKVLNVRSGSELPEKCRELALHFETQGTPVMIGGGVLAYTLLGVDYNETSGDCAFLILDPHYTGSDDLKKITSGGWCGWKKAVDSKGKHFFLHDKFYNLLLPQRPNMV